MEGCRSVPHDRTYEVPCPTSSGSSLRRSVGGKWWQLPQCALPCALQRPQQRRPILLPRAAAALTPAVRLGWRSGCPRRAWKAFDVGWGARVRAWAYRCLRCLSWCGGGVSNAGAERSPKMSTAARGLITCRNILSREVMKCTH